MKKFNKILMVSIAMMTMVLSSCNKEKVFEQESNGTISVSVNGILGEYSHDNDTKANLINTTRVQWVAGDKVYVYDGATCLGELTVSLKDEKDYYAILTGDEITVPQEGTSKLTLVYSNKFASAPTISEGKVKLDMAEQTGSTSATNLPFVAYATLDYTSDTPEIKNQIADFSFATSIIRLNCTGLEANTAIKEVTLCGMSDQCVLEITGSGVTVAEGEIGDIDVSLSGVSANSKGTQTIYAAVAKNDENVYQTIHVKQAKDYFYSFDIRKNGAGKSYNAICQLKERLFIPAKFSVSDTKKVYFSIANLYANGTALHFEDDQHKANNTWSTSHVSLFSWSSTVASAVSVNNSGNNIFCDESHKISVDGSDAMFYVLSVAEWQYLLFTRTNAAGKRKSVTVNSRKGWVLAPDDVNLSSTKTSYTEAELDAANLVFLPLAGWRSGGGTYINAFNSEGYYWSSSKNGGNAYSASFNASNLNYGHLSLFNQGIAIRLVTDATN